MGMGSIPVIIVLGEHADLGKVRGACRAHGLTNISALEKFGLLRGMIEADRKEGLTKIPGVRSVEDERRVQSLPDRPIPQREY